MKLFLQKDANFWALAAKPPDPRASGDWGRSPQTPKTASLIASFWLRACHPPKIDHLLTWRIIASANYFCCIILFVLELIGQSITFLCSLFHLNRKFGIFLKIRVVRNGQKKSPWSRFRGLKYSFCIMKLSPKVKLQRVWMLARQSTPGNYQTCLWRNILWQNTQC